MEQSINNEGVEPIAIIGMSCRFPDASNIHEFRKNLQKAKESVVFFSKEEMLETGADSNLINNSRYINSGCILEDIEMFDHSFFGYSSSEAELIDPQQRIFLECAYEAFEDAGCLPHTYNGDIGVFGGMRTSGYSKVLNPILKKPGSVRSFEALLGTTVDQACMRISHVLNLKGPSVGIQTACSASIVAIHMACESLRNGECRMALAGASAIYIPQKQGYSYDPDMISSPDGHCRAFDTKAKGTISGNGVGMVLLKPLSDAIENHDHIYAVIRGNAVNNDGSAKAGYRTPSLEGQTRVIEEALLISGVNAETITYVEANGTGTLLGDSIEIEALSRVFQMQTDKKHFCGIGSVKTNIGHLTQAAGIAALIKTALSLKYKQLFPSLNCNTPNPSLKETPFYVVQKPLEWKVTNMPRRAGINSFAIGGTNAHLVLEEAPSMVKKSQSEHKTSFHILTLSAKKDTTLIDMVNRYKNFIESNTDCTLEDICFTSNTGRFHYPFRFSVLTNSKEKLFNQIKDWLVDKNNASEFISYGKRAKSPKVIFLFSDIPDEILPKNDWFYKNHPQFTETINQCAVILKKIYGALPKLSYLFGNPNENINYCDPISLFVIEFSLFKMFESWGISPYAVTGHGIGEYVASCAAGALSLEDGLELLIENEIDLQNTSGNKVKTIQPLFSDTTAENRSFTSKIELISTENEYFKKQNADFFVLIGPDKTFPKRCLKDTRQQSIASQSFQGDQNEWRQTLQLLGELYVRGENLNWDIITNDLPYYRTSLPTYPFDKKACWFMG